MVVVRSRKIACLSRIETALFVASNDEEENEKDKEKEKKRGRCINMMMTSNKQFPT
jgi:hypothetical protein